MVWTRRAHYRRMEDGMATPGDAPGAKQQPIRFLAPAAKRSFGEGVPKADLGNEFCEFLGALQARVAVDAAGAVEVVLVDHAVELAAVDAEDARGAGLVAFLALQDFGDFRLFDRR